MPSKKKKSKAAKGRKPAAGKGADNASVNEQNKMQRLRIGDKQQAGDEDGVEALLEEAIKLAAIEKQEIEENCTHGYNPSSKFQARYCADYLKTFTESYYASTREGGNAQFDRLTSVADAYNTALDTSIRTTNVSRNRSNKQCINPYCLAEGTKFILDGKSNDARLPAMLALITKKVDAAALLDRQKLLELMDGDEHTLVQFFRKQIPCSCLDEKYKEVKSIPKMGVCFSGQCPLPGNMAVRSKMLRCTGCLDDQYVSYCSRECQEAHWSEHKKFCGKTVEEIEEMYPNK